MWYSSDTYRFEVEHIFLENLCISAHEQAAIQTKDFQNKSQECQCYSKPVKPAAHKALTCRKLPLFVFGIAKALMSLFLPQYTQEITKKLNTRRSLHPYLFLLDKLKKKKRMPRKCGIISCCPRCQVGFRIWPATCFDFGTPVLQLPGHGHGMTVDVVRSTG